MTDTGPNIRPEDEVVRICQELIRIDTSNYGDGSGPGERAAAEYTAGLMAEVGLDAEIFESAPRPGQRGHPAGGGGPVAPAPWWSTATSTSSRPSRDEWSVDPFGAELKDGLIWGRGAVDMKDMDAMILSVLRDFARTGRKPKRDLIFAFFADEEAGGTYGARYAVDNRPELFEGATEAISEVGGFSATIGGQRTYLLQTAEKGLSWLRLVAHGRAGHGSQINTDNAVTTARRRGLADRALPAGRSSSRPPRGSSSTA